MSSNSNTPTDSPTPPSFDSSYMDGLTLTDLPPNFLNMDVLLPNIPPSLNFPNVPVNCEKAQSTSKTFKLPYQLEKLALHNNVGPGNSRAGEKQSFLQLLWFYFLKLQATVKIFRFPWQKPTLHNIITFRIGNARAGKRHSTFPQIEWSYSEPVRTTYTCQIFAGGSPHLVPTMPIRCRRFVPGPSDVLVEPYQVADGEIILVQTPPFACVDIDTPKMREVLEAYIRDCKPLLIEDMLNTTYLNLNDDIYRLGLREAARFASERKGSVVSSALEILACVYVGTTQSIMVGSETLDVSPIDNEKISIYGKCPVPSVLDTQIDTLYIYHMHSLMKKIAKSLDQLIFAKNSIENWYEIFLAIFVLFMSLEKVYMAQLLYVRRSPQRLAADVSYYMISKWKSSAKNLLYHFRCVLKGMVPFSPSWDPKKQKQIELDAMSLEYIETMSKILVQRKAELTALREEGGENSHARPLVWLVELFLD